MHSYNRVGRQSVQVRSRVSIAGSRCALLPLPLEGKHNVSIIESKTESQETENHADALPHRSARAASHSPGSRERSGRCCLERARSCLLSPGWNVLESQPSSPVPAKAAQESRSSKNEVP